MNYKQYIYTYKHIYIYTESPNKKTGFELFKIFHSDDRTTLGFNNFSDCFRGQTVKVEKFGFPEPQNVIFCWCRLASRNLEHTKIYYTRGTQNLHFWRVMTHTLRASKPSFFHMGTWGPKVVFLSLPEGLLQQKLSGCVTGFFCGTYIQQLTGEGLISMKLPHMSQNNVPNNPCPFCARNNNSLNDGIPNQRD